MVQYFCFRARRYRTPSHNTKSCHWEQSSRTSSLSVNKTSLLGHGFFIFTLCIPNGVHVLRVHFIQGNSGLYRGGSGLCLTFMCIIVLFRSKTCPSSSPVPVLAPEVLTSMVSGDWTSSASNYPYCNHLILVRGTKICSVFRLTSRCVITSYPLADKLDSITGPGGV